jgi:hypothetical protein
MMRSRGIRLDEAISKEEVEEVQRHLRMQSSRSTDLKVENLWVDNRCLLLSSMVSESCPYGLWIWCGFGRVAASIPFVPPEAIPSPTAGSISGTRFLFVT